MKQLTLGSLFDGIGGFCYAAGIPSGIDTGCTIKPLWAAEVEPNCIDITRYRFKDVMHVGSVTELKGDEISTCGYYNLWKSLPRFEHSRKEKRT